MPVEHRSLGTAPEFSHREVRRRLTPGPSGLAATADRASGQQRRASNRGLPLSQDRIAQGGGQARRHWRTSASVRCSVHHRNSWPMQLVDPAQEQPSWRSFRFLVLLYLSCRHSDAALEDDCEETYRKARLRKCKPKSING